MFHMTNPLSFAIKWKMQSDNRLIIKHLQKH